MPQNNRTLVQALSLCAGSVVMTSAKCGLLGLTLLGWVLHVGPVRESRGGGTKPWSVLSTSPGFELSSKSTGDSRWGQWVRSVSL